MRKILICGAALAVTATTPAAIAAKPDPDKPKPPATSPYGCVPKNVGFNARGTLVSSELTQTAGADTAKRGDDRYSGKLTVDVKKANHKAAKGEQALTLTNARVKFHPRKDTEVAAGDRVKLTGKITTVAKKCQDEFTPTITVKKVDIKAAKAPKTDKV